MGFVKDDGSTTTNLLESLNDWTLSIQCKHSVKIAYVDFSKAFDTVIYAAGLEWNCWFFVAVATTVFFLWTLSQNHGL